MSRTPDRRAEPGSTPDPGAVGSAPPPPQPPRSKWVRHVGLSAAVDIRILSDRTDDGGTITRMVDRHGKKLHAEAIIGRPGREDEVAIVIARRVTELLRDV